MAIVKMSKFNLVAFESQKSHLLKKLQNFREVDFIDLELDKEVVENSDPILKKIVNNEELTKIDESLNSVDNAVKLLRRYHIADKSLKAMMRGNKSYTFEKLAEKSQEYNWKEVSEELKKLGNTHAGIKSQISKKYSEIDELSVWNKLDANPQSLKKLKNVTSYLGTVPIKLKNSFIDYISQLEHTYYEELKISKDDVYYLVISDKSIKEKEKLDEVFRNSSFSLSIR